MSATLGAGSRTDPSPMIVRRRSSLAALFAGVLLTSLPLATRAASALPTATPTPDTRLATKDFQKAAVACQKVISKVTAKVVADKFKALDACANVALSCVQTKQDDTKCLANAGKTCAKQLNKATSVLTKAKAKMVAAKSCATGLRLPDLLSADGLGLGQVAGQCQNDFGIDICAGLDPLAECLVRTHDNAAGALYSEARPRTGELLTLLHDVTLPPVEGLQTFPGCEQCSVEVANRKPIEQCGRALTKTTQTLVAKLEGTYGACAQKVLACVQTNADPSACLTKAKAGCEKGAGTIANAIQKFATAVAKKCGSSAVDFGQLTSAGGLNLDALAGSCPSLGASAPTNADTLATCLQQRATCTVSGLVRQSIARVGEFETQNELGALSDDLTATCPTVPAPASVKAIQGARFNFGSILVFMKQVRLVHFGPIVKVPTKGGPPISSPGTGRGVTILNGPTRVNFGTITKIPFNYRLFRARSLQSGRTESSPTLIVTVQRDDLALGDHFEIPLDPALTEDQLELTYQNKDTLPGCAFTLALAIRDNGIVSEYTPLLQVVDTALPTPTSTPTAAPGRLVDNGDGTVTDTQSGLQWEQKTGTLGTPVDCSQTACSDPHEVNNIYRWCLDANHDFACDNPGNPADGGAFTDFLAKLNTPPCFAGHCDWQLPSEEGQNSPFTGAKELESILLAPFPCGTIPCIDPIFGPTVAATYWSATSFATGPFFAWDVNFDNGNVLRSTKINRFYVRAVRAASSSRFVDNGDGTVTDTQSGLQWEQKTGTVGTLIDCSQTACPDAHDVNNTYQWCLDANFNSVCDNPGNPPDGGAFTDFLVKLNTSPCFAAHCDWRLPSEEGENSPFTGAKELESILAPFPCGTSPCIDPIFGPTVAGNYWSATTIATSPNDAWGVNFLDGVFNGNKGFSLYVRAVRAGS